MTRKPNGMTGRERRRLGRMLTACLCLSSGWADAQGPAGQGQHDHGPAASARRGPWTMQPLVVPARGGPPARTSVRLDLQRMKAEALRVCAPDLESNDACRQVPVAAEGPTSVDALPGIGNYYWIGARTEGEGEVRVASTAHYFVNPGPAPTRLLELPKSELEIRPLRLPREHALYRETEEWRFAVLFQGDPLANQPVTLETEPGSRIRFTSDADGVVRVSFPRDIPPERAGEQGAHRGPRRVPFVLSTEHVAAGVQYRTAFNHTYGTAPDSGRSLWVGAGFGLLGMLLATPLLRHRPAAATARTGADA